MHALAYVLEYASVRVREAGVCAYVYPCVLYARVCCFFLGGGGGAQQCPLGYATMTGFGRLGNNKICNNVTYYHYY